MVGAAADFLVDREADTNRSVLELRIPLQVRDGGHDLRDAGLVVAAQQRGAVGGDDVVTDLLASSGSPPDRGRCSGRPGSSIRPPS